MKTLFDDIVHHLRKADIVDYSIYLLLFTYVTGLFFPGIFMRYAALDSNAFLRMPWQVITYAVVHLKFYHIFINLLILFYIGNLFLDFFSPRQYLLYFLSGALTGGIFFLMFFLLHHGKGVLIGASAAISAILVGLTVKIPHYELRIRFIGSVKLWVLTLLWILISIAGTAGVNAGGAVAHLGGAVSGFVLSVFLHEGKIFHRKKPVRESPFAKIYRQNNTSGLQPDVSQKRIERKINEILEKINRSGYDSLTEKEKEFLMQQKDPS